MTFHHIVYLSTPTVPPTVEVLDALLRQWRQANAASGITGLLLCGQRRFAQLIEGETVAVLNLYQRLQHDERHHSLLRMADKRITTPVFETWHMAYRREATSSPPLGYLPLTTAEWPAYPLPTVDALLLETMRRLVAAD